mmetsp:Transcript_36457/g.95200  ORF Transcript_36457/g.95200 Transcript_36457/m.95200 type:complete len:228 (-) Transcript_36457:1274-1957(-)
MLALGTEHTLLGGGLKASPTTTTALSFSTFSRPCSSSTSHARSGVLYWGWCCSTSRYCFPRYPTTAPGTKRLRTDSWPMAANCPLAVRCLLKLSLERSFTALSHPLSAVAGCRGWGRGLLGDLVFHDTSLPFSMASRLLADMFWPSPPGSFLAAWMAASRAAKGKPLAARWASSSDREIFLWPSWATKFSAPPPSLCTQDMRSVSAPVLFFSFRRAASAGFWLRFSR